MIVVAVAPAASPSIVVVPVTPQEFAVVVVTIARDDSGADDNESSIRVPAKALDDQPTVRVTDAPHEDAITLPVERVLEESVFVPFAQAAGAISSADDAQEYHVARSIGGALESAVAGPSPSPVLRVSGGGCQNDERESQCQDLHCEFLLFCCV